MPAQESTVGTAMDAMPQNIDDRLLESVKKFYRDELGESSARKVCSWPSLDVLSRFKAYKEEEYEVWERAYQAAEERHAEEKRRREAERQQSNRGFWRSVGDFLGDTTRGIGHIMSLPTKPDQISDEEALQDINLLQRYLRSVTQPGMKPLHFAPTVGRALQEFNQGVLRNMVAYNYLCGTWDRRGVEEIANIGNEQIYQETAKEQGYLNAEEEQAIRRDIKAIMQYLRQINSQYHSNHRRR